MPKKICSGKTPVQTFRECKNVAVDKTNQLAYDKAAFDSRYFYDNTGA
ncbi:MAG: hypothetical protein LBJ96_00515 [Holosporaceae bacterium]|nr:hypothetical protein [Holosporaceae bacterium]